MMTKSQSPLNSNMQRRRGQGWAAFNRKQREEQGSGTECNVDPYPSISKTTSSTAANSLIKNNGAPVRDFSSIIRPSVGFLPVTCNCESQAINDNAHANNQIDQIDRESDSKLVKMLKDIYTWAGQSLIEDVLAAVNNDVDQASILLKAMVSSKSKLEDPSVSGPSSCTVSGPDEDKSKCLENNNFVANKLPDGLHEVLICKTSFSVPVEPEWEEDDVYLSHRKDAVRMMRLASQHSRAASNAFLRGDHISAQQYSLRSRDEWIAAEKLNTNAAKEILHIRNRNNDVWKIDLHGLHASEAVSALKEHLQKIESAMALKHSDSSDALAKMEVGSSSSALCGRVGVLEMNSETKKKELPQQRQNILHVITGMGNHSRGHAALPTAIKSFLIENGYCFDDAWPGVFAVRPKFRHN